MRKFAKLAVVSGSVAAILAAAGAPAMAAGNPTTGQTGASVNVVSAITLSVTSPASFSFGSLNAGGQATQPAAITYNVTSDDAGGYSVTEASSNWSSGGADFPASAMKMTISGVKSGATTNFTESTNPQTVATSNQTTAGSAYSEDLMLTVPGGTSPGAYAATVTDVAVAS